MSKKDFLNVALLIFVIILASVIYLSEEENTALDTLTDININDINSITIQHNQNNTTLVKNSKNLWQITRPVNIAANKFRINSLLKLLGAPVHNQYLPAEIDLKTIGLHAPQTGIQFNNLNITFGITNPATNLRYIKLNNTIYTIEDVYYPLISSHFSTLASLNLLPAGSRIDKIILPEQIITRDEQGLWRSNRDASADKISETIQHWQQDQAFGLHKYLQREKLGEILIYLRDRDQPITYIITDKQPWLILARPEIDLEYHLDIEAYNNLISPADHNKRMEKANQKPL